MRPLLPILLITILLLILPRDSQAREEGWLLSARNLDGQYDLWAVPASGGPWQQLTMTPGDERWPAWHPEGHTIAYSARRDRNWDIYTLDLRTGEERRLTHNPHFEGWPAWSPDGRRLAFASAREGDLDLFLLDPNRGEETNLTATSTAHDFEPRWEDDGQLLFVSTRDQSHDIFRLELASGTVTSLGTTAQRHERSPLRSPASEALFLLVEEGHRREILRFDGSGAERERLAWTSPVIAATLSPTGEEIAWLERREAGDILYRRAADGGTIQRLNGPTPRLEDLAWGLAESALMRARIQPVTAAPRPSRPPEPAPSRFVRLADLQTGLPRLSEAVLPRFQALRGRVAGELGNDFLGRLSEAARPINFSSADSDYLSWHKAGRAVDILLDLGWRQGFQMLEIVREELNGDVYWRIWLRCPVHDGSCGQPLVEAPWDHSPGARSGDAADQGGKPKDFQPGYYVDFTRLAFDEGWERIASYQSADFDWRRNKMAMEYWHFQYTDGYRWYETMRSVIPPEEMEEWFGWEVLRARRIPRWQLKAKGVPLPPGIRHGPAEIVVP